MNQPIQDQELDAIARTIAALEPLDEGARQRVLEYVMERLSIGAIRMSVRRSQPPSGAGAADTDEGMSGSPAFAQTDIRRLKDAKAPETAQEMAIVVAYYLSELAPIAERKSTINSSDLQIYFKQAKFPLPRSMKDLLPNAKKAGYVDNVAPGEYRLNSVGYNLAAHGLPHGKPA